MQTRKVIHFRDKCIGCNACVENAPQNWMMDPKDGKSRLIGAKDKKGIFVGEVFECDVEQNKIAADACPVKIIKVD